MSTGTCPAAMMARSTAAAYEVPLGKSRSSEVCETNTFHRGSSPEPANLKFTPRRRLSPHRVVPQSRIREGKAESGLPGQQGGKQVAVLCHSGQGVFGGEEEVGGVLAGFHFGPGDGGGDGGELAGAQGVGGDGGLGAVVLAPVDEDLAGP